MKTMKRALALVLALTMLLALSAVTALAADTQHTITINNPQAGHTYDAYQIFSGNIRTVTADGKSKTVLTDIEWGSGVKSTELLTALKANETLKTDFENCTTAEDVANVLKDYADSNSSAKLDTFAKVVGENLSTTVAGSSTENTSTGSGSTYTITVPADGYYLVKDRSVTSSQTATKYILQVVKDVTVDAKADTPTIDKVIVNADSANGGEGNGTAQDVGSSVHFKLTSEVPHMDGYDSYTYTITDTLSEGLTFNNDVVIVIKGANGGSDVTLTQGSDYTVTTNGQTFTIDFLNFINRKNQAGQTIEITYSATINENALTRNEETNTVHLEYSNNPNDSTSKGKTPDEVVYVYDFDIVIDKYTKVGNTETRLSGAKFVLKKTVNGTDQYYYWNDINKKVEWKTVDNAASLTTEEAWTAAGVTVKTTGADGKATFQGLDFGEYQLVEIEAPNGYNQLKEPVLVTITATYDNNGKLTSSSATVGENNGQYSQTVQVENNSGAELPSTGGIGTTIFYVLGGLLVVCAGVLLITKRRMSKEA